MLWTHEARAFVRRCLTDRPGAAAEQSRRGPREASRLTGPVYQPARAPHGAMIGTCWPYARGRTSTVVFTGDTSRAYRTVSGWPVSSSSPTSIAHCSPASMRRRRQRRRLRASGRWSTSSAMSATPNVSSAFRLIWFARGAPSELPGFDQDAWVEAAPQPAAHAGGLTRRVRQGTPGHAGDAPHGVGRGCPSPRRCQRQSDHGARLRLDDCRSCAAPPGWTPRASSRVISEVQNFRTSCHRNLRRCRGVEAMVQFCNCEIGRFQ